jgi:hypothetical protein
MPKPDPDNRPWAATRHGLADQLSHIDGLLAGSVVVRHMRCGKPTCACKAEPPALHGPYIQWTRSVGGKTVTRFLTAEQLARYQDWFDNARRLKELIAKIEIASLHAFDAEQRHNPATREPPRRPRRRPRSGA